MTKPVIALSAAVLAVGIVAAYMWQELRTSREQISALQTRVNELQNSQMLGRAMPSPASPVVVPAAPGTATTTESAPVAATTARPGDNRAAMADMIKQLINSPEARNMGRSMLAQSLPDLGKELNLNPTEEEKLLDLITKQQADTASNALGMLGQGGQDAAARQQLQQQLQDRQKANQAEIAAMLGPKYPQYQQYQETLPTRNQVNQLKTQLTGSNALSDSQSKNLITALAAEQKRINDQPRAAAPAAGGNPQAYMAEQAKRREDNNRRLVDAASTQLNAQQLETYKKSLEQQRGFGNMQGAGRRQGGAGLPAGF